MTPAQLTAAVRAAAVSRRQGRFPFYPRDPIMGVRSSPSSIVAGVVNAVTSGTESGSVLTSLASPSFACVAGDTILVILRYFAGTPTGVSDTAGNSYSSVAGASSSGSNENYAVYVAQNIKGGSANVATLAASPGVTFASLHVLCLHGVGAVDVSDHANGTSTAIASNGYTPAFDPDVVVACFSSDGGGPALSNLKIGGQTASQATSTGTNTKTAWLPVPGKPASVQSTATVSASAPWGVTTIGFKAVVPAYFAGEIVHSSFATLTGSPQSWPVLQAVPAGTLLVAAVMDDNGGNNTFQTFSDSKGNAWVTDGIIQQQNGHTGAIGHCVVANALTTSDTVTTTWAGGAWGGFGIDVVAFGGLDTYRAASLSGSPGPLTVLSQPGDVLVGFTSGTGGNPTPQGAPWVSVVPLWNSQRGWMLVEYKPSAAVDDSYNPNNEDFEFVAAFYNSGVAARRAQPVILDRQAIQRAAVR